MKFDTAGKRVVFLRSLSGLTRKEFEEKYNIPVMTLRTWESATHLKDKATQRFLTAIRQEGIKCYDDWLMSGNGQIPSINDALSASQTELSELGNDFDEAISEEIYFLQRKYKNKFTAVLINDDSNFPFLTVGDYVGGIPVTDIATLIKKLCIIENDEGVILVRQLIATDDPNKYHLRSYNLDIEFPILYNQKIKKAFKVIWIRKRTE